MMKELRDHFMTCPYLGASEHGFIMLGVDFLDSKPVSYSLESVGGSEWQTRFQGSNNGIKLLNFVFSSMEAFSSEVITNLTNLEFYDNFSNWNDRTKPPYPMIDIELSRPQLQFVTDGEDLARYQIIGTLLYRV